MASKPVGTAKRIPRWDPFSVENDIPSESTLRRVRLDLIHLFADPPPGLFVVPDEQDLLLIHVIIIGVLDTPYEGGLFYFLVRFTGNYPIEAPKVKFMTTDGGHVRFNPNLYKNGKVCLSILGTWDGPAWSPAMQLSTLLLSIQTLLSEKPYFNEPGITVEMNPGDSDCYSEVVRHETLRVAVCGMIENTTHLNIPTPLIEIMKRCFLEHYEIYESIAKRKLSLNGTRFMDPYKDNQGIFRYDQILAKLIEIRGKLTSGTSS